MSNGTSKGHWDVMYLYLHQMDFQENRSRCPAICEFIEQLGTDPSVPLHEETVDKDVLFPRHYHHAFVSAMAPETHIAAHHGPMNLKLRVQFPLILPSATSKGMCLRKISDGVYGCVGCSLRVGSETRHVLLFFPFSHFLLCSWRKERQLFSTIVMNTKPSTSMVCPLYCIVCVFVMVFLLIASQTRIILIFDIFHPSLSVGFCSILFPRSVSPFSFPREIKFFSYLHQGGMKSLQRLEEEDSSFSFYQLIKREYEKIQTMPETSSNVFEHV